MSKNYDDNREIKISRIVDKEVDCMSIDELRFNLKFLFRESYQDYSQEQIDTLYDRMVGIPFDEDDGVYRD